MAIGSRLSEEQFVKFVQFVAKNSLRALRVLRGSNLEATAR